MDLGKILGNLLHSLQETKDKEEATKKTELDFFGYNYSEKEESNIRYKNYIIRKRIEYYHRQGEFKFKRLKYEDSFHNKNRTVWDKKKEYLIRSAMKR